VTAAGIFLLVVALVVGMASCAADSSPEPTPPVQYSLTISSTEGGVVTTPGEGVFKYEEGTVVRLVGEAKEGYRFVNWTGNASTIDDASSVSTTVRVSDNYSIAANFVARYTLTVDSSDGGDVSTPGEGTFTYDAGTVVSLVAQAEQGYHLVNWTGDVTTVANVTGTTTSITMNGDCIITPNFAVTPYFRTDAWLRLYAPAGLQQEERDPWVALCVMTNIVVDSVQVDLPDGASVIVPAHTSVFTPDVDQMTQLSFCTGVAGMPIAGGEYTFTGLDQAGEPVPGARNTDVWVGVEAPEPPTNVRAEVVEDGVLVDWDGSAIIPGSFEPAAENRLGYYQLWISSVETGEWVYGASRLSGPPYLIPWDTADFVEGRDFGVSLGEMEDGVYSLAVCVLSIAPEGSLGWGFEYDSSDPGEVIVIAIDDGEVTIE
jgi:hypothetical protein